MKIVNTSSMFCFENEVIIYNAIIQYFSLLECRLNSFSQLRAKRKFERISSKSLLSKLKFSLTKQNKTCVLFTEHKFI